MRTQTKQRFFQTKHDFKPILHMLQVVQAHVDPNAYIGKLKDTNQPVLRYRQTDGTKITIGRNGYDSRRVINEENKFLTERQCADILVELGIMDAADAQRVR